MYILRLQITKGRNLIKHMFEKGYHHDNIQVICLLKLRIIENEKMNENEKM